MFENRFRELQPLARPQSVVSSPAFAFFFLPCDASSAGMGLSWLYQRAFESAREAVFASRQRDYFAASLN